MSDSKFHIEDETRQYFAEGELLQETSTLLPETPRPSETARLIRTVGLNTFYQIGAQVAPAIAAVAAIPILLRYLGAEPYGIVTLFSTALIYFTMLDLGLGRASTRFIAQSLEAKQPEDVRRYFWSSILLLTAAGVVVSLCFLLAVPSLVSNYLKISPAYHRAAIESFRVISVTIPLVTLTAGLRGFLEASGRFPFLSLVTAFTGVGMYVLPVLVVMAGGGLVWIAIAYVLVRIGLAAAFAIGCLRVKGRPSLRPALSSKAIKNMVSFGGWLSVSNVVGTGMVYGDRFLLGSCVGMVAVTSYSMPLDVIGRMQIVITSFCAVLFPLMSRLDSSGSAHFQTVYRGAVAIVMSLLTPMTVGMILLSPFLMKIWLRARNTPDAVFSAEVFLAGSIVQAMASVSFTALHARGRSDLTAGVHMTEFPIYCVAFYWAATRFGVRGASLVWLGRAVVDFICMAVSLQIQERGRSILVPEMAAALVSIGILVMVALKTPNAALLGAGLCIATWLWSWRALLDSRLRFQFSRAIGSARSLLGEMAGTHQNR
jgi:O-antigen/teichoic acid export membrane protein